MIHPAFADVIRLLKQLVSMLQPIARSSGITLQFESQEEEIALYFRADLVIHDITSLIFHIINYVPEGNSITLTAGIEKEELRITVTNSGINLSCVAEIVRSCRQKVTVHGNNVTKRTEFGFSMPLAKDPELKSRNEKLDPGIDKKIIPEYYDEIRKRLRSHFSKADTLVAQLSILYPKEAAFLQKINSVIVSNMDNELFDTSSLSREMNMSRTSLFRRLKPLIQQPPATYIKSIRLQKAKDLLETTDITVGEAAFKTGFQTQSYFTKAFMEMFGFLPSAIRRKNADATKK